jgi:hypothetical protein
MVMLLKLLMCYIKNLRFQPFCFFLIIAAGFLFSSVNTFATVPQTDTVYKSKLHKISKKEFLDQYGYDDSTRALIRYFFKDRSKSKKSLIIFGGVTLLAAIVALNDGPGNTLLIGVYIACILLVLLGSIIVLFNIYFLVSNSRKKLYRILQAYQNNTPLPKKIVQQSLFKEYLKTEQDKL